MVDAVRTESMFLQLLEVHHTESRQPPAAHRVAVIDTSPKVTHCSGAAFPVTHRCNKTRPPHSTIPASAPGKLHCSSFSPFDQSCNCPTCPQVLIRRALPHKPPPSLADSQSVSWGNPPLGTAVSPESRC